MRYQLKVGER